MVTNMSTYDRQNIFAKILRQELPCHKIHEDKHVLAFLDVMPRAHGHTLIIPKNPARNLLDIGESDFLSVMAWARNVALAAMKAFAADGVTVQQFSEEAAGQMVFHLHVHVIPRHKGVALKPPASDMEDDSVLAENANKLRAALADI